MSSLFYRERGAESSAHPGLARSDGPPVRAGDLPPRRETDDQRLARAIVDALQAVGEVTVVSSRCIRAPRASVDECRLMRRVGAVRVIEPLHSWT